MIRYNTIVVNKNKKRNLKKKSSIKKEKNEKCPRFCAKKPDHYIIWFLGITVKSTSTTILITITDYQI